MPVASSTIASRLEQLRQQLPMHVQLLAVSKGHSLSALEQAYAAGQCCFAESRLQEAKPKIEAFSAAAKTVEWHFIGQLQANKVRAIVQRFTWIHSLTTAEQVQRIERIASEERRCPNVLLQVKLRPDRDKLGFDPNQLSRALPQLVHLNHLQLRGLMTITPLNLEPGEQRAVFRDCRCLAQQLKQHMPHVVAERFDQLSMGMSGDWPAAVSEGSTLLRIGTAIFGAREALTGQPL